MTQGVIVLATVAAVLGAILAAALGSASGNNEPQDTESDPFVEV